MTLPKNKSSILARRWDALRFRLSCVLYRHPLSITSSLLVVGLAVGGVGYSALTAKVHPSPAPTLAQAHTPSPQTNQLEDEQLKQLSVHLSTLDAQANRLDALGQQWVERMGLESESFDFSMPPFQGDGYTTEDGEDMTASSLVDDAAVLATRYTRLETQLNVLDSLTKIGEKFPDEVPHASPAYGHMTSSFGTRHDPFGRGRRFHSGIDLAARMGDPVMAMAEGKVIFSGTKGAYGKMVEIDHGNGYKTRYAHNSALLAKVGDEIQVGQIIAKAGSTGRSTGVHLHVEVWKNGVAVNPRPFLDRGRQLLQERQRALAPLDDLPNPKDVLLAQSTNENQKRPVPRAVIAGS